MMEIHDDVGHRVGDEVADDPAEEWFAGNGHGRLGTNRGERHQARSEARAEHQSGPARRHRGVFVAGTSSWCRDASTNVVPDPTEVDVWLPRKAPRSDRDLATNRTRLGRAERNPRHEQTNEDIHRETFERERREAQIADDGHLEDPDSLHEWDGVVPLRVRPVIPELPEHAAQHSARRQIHEPIETALANVSKE